MIFIKTIVINELIIELHRLTREPLCIHQDDAMGCFDRIIRNYQQPEIHSTRERLQSTYTYTWKNEIQESKRKKYFRQSIHQHHRYRATWCRSRHIWRRNTLDIHQHPDDGISGARSTRMHRSTTKQPPTLGSRDIRLRRLLKTLR